MWTGAESPVDVGTLALVLVLVLVLVMALVLLLLLLIFKSLFPPLRDAGGRGSWTEDVVLKFVLKSAEAVLADGDTGDKGDRGDTGEWP